jgi:hypothetical protein
MKLTIKQNTLSSDLEHVIVIYQNSGINVLENNFIENEATFNNYFRKKITGIATIGINLNCSN